MDCPEQSQTSPKSMLFNEIFDFLLVILIDWAALLFVVFTSTLQFPSSSAFVLILLVIQDAFNVIFSLASAQPQSTTVVLRCNTMFEETIAGKVTSVFPWKENKRENKRTQ